MSVTSIFIKKIKNFFSHKSVIFSDDKNVIRFNITSHVLIVVFILFSILTIAFSFNYYSYTKNKHNIDIINQELQQTRDINAHLVDTIDKISAEVNQFSRYFDFINNVNNSELQNHEKKNKKSKLSKKKNKKKSDINMKYVEGVRLQMSNLMSNLYNKSSFRITQILNKITDVGLVHNVVNEGGYATQLNKMIKKIKLSDYENHQGGPLELYIENRNNYLAKSNFVEEQQLGSDLYHKETDLLKKVNYLINLEKVSRTIPIGSPFEKNYIITSRFCYRLDPVNKKDIAAHKGVDLYAETNSPVLATKNGVVKVATTSETYGNTVLLYHGYGIHTRYAHLNKINVSVGDTVKSGSILGTQGSSGRTSGEHLHYEVIYNDNKIDPIKFIKSDKI